VTVVLTMNRDGANADFTYQVDPAGGGVADFVAYSKLFFTLRRWTFVAVDVTP
jgi:hypothetical protein